MSYSCPSFVSMTTDPQALHLGPHNLLRRNLYVWGRDGVGSWSRSWAFQRFSKRLTFLLELFVFLMLKVIVISAHKT